MKKVCLLLVTLLMVFLCACQQNTDLVLTVGGRDYTVDKTNHSITDGTHTYTYTSDSFKTTITYPDGSTYWFTKKDNGSFSLGSMGWSEDYDEHKYVSGETLEQVLSYVDHSSSVNGDAVFGALFCFAMGAFGVFAPKAAWYLGRGWMFKNAEPSDAVLVVYRIIGGVCVLLGIALLVNGN